MNFIGKNKERLKNQIINKTKKFIIVYFIVGLLFIIFLPFFLKLSNALRGPLDYRDPNVVLIPATLTMNNFISAFNQLDYKTIFFNTLFISGITAIIQVLATATAGYTFSRLKFKGSNILFYLILFTITIPYESLHISRVLFFNTNYFFGIKLIGNLFSIYIMSAFGMGIRSALFIYIFKQYFDEIPKELEESAQLDGAGVLDTFWRVSLPQVKGGILSVGIFSFVWQWNDFYFANFYNISTNRFTVFSTKFLSRRMANIDSASLLMMLPLLIGYIILQGYFVGSFDKFKIK